MDSTGYLPDNDLGWIVRLDFIGVERRDIVVDEAVDEQHRNL